MRLENAKIEIKGSAKYEREVERLVTRILTTKTGQAIGFLIRHYGWCVIKESDADDLNADTRYLGLHQSLINFYPNTDVRHADVSLKTAGGITLKVNTIRQNPGWEPDEVLFHEMVHAGRFLSNEDGPTKEEEYFAVLIANIYISEKGKSNKDLRYRYELFSRGLTEEEVKPLVYLFQYDTKDKVDHYDLIAKFCGQHTTVAPMIGEAPAKFNPIRDYYKSKEINVPVEPPQPLPVRVTANVDYTYINDEYLIGMLEPRFLATDVAGYGQRARKLEQVFASLKVIEAAPLLFRLVMRRAGDRVAMLFHGHLSTATRVKLIGILRTRLTKYN